MKNKGAFETFRKKDEKNGPQVTRITQGGRRPQAKKALRDLFRRN